MSPRATKRCAWAPADQPRYLEYHDTEWGVPSHDEVHLFEMLTLEGAQAGLSWSTILNKREGYRQAFAGFDVARIARFGARDVERLMADTRIVRNRGKITSTIDNARAVLSLRDAGESFHDLLWDFVDGTPVRNRFKAMSDLPAQTPVSRAMSKALKRKGFRFVGPTVCYAFMQAVGMVNDHETSCFRWRECDAVR